MTKNEFSKFVEMEEKRLEKFCERETDNFMLKKELALKELAMKVLKTIASSEKTSAFKSMLKKKSFYGTCGVSIASEYSWNEIYMYFVIGPEEKDLIKIHSDINEHNERYWHVINYKTDQFYGCHNVEALIECLENLSM